ncbi:MAG: hypothetical protein HYR88_07200 [Verrucomicrobia bacterium]|nr:hypothetical protein [Verrucomicrobiota bacterium]MBI3868935.1 hypothetical protein [Verrucomicrobiota bacterium]
MKIESNETRTGGEELIAMFGDAKCVKIDGHFYLRGGSMADRTEALEWVMMFMPDEVVRLDG